MKSLDKFDIKINAAGGGVKGQAEAAKLGIARVLLEVNPEFRPALKAAGFLKRDPRGVERKKFGQKKARRASSSLNVNCMFNHNFQHIKLSNQYKWNKTLHYNSNYSKQVYILVTCEEVESKNVALHFC